MILRTPRRGPMSAERCRRGGASLAVLLLLLVAMLLVAAWAQRNMLTELRIAANQVRGTIAFEAAEAGLSWVQAMLNSGSALGSDCLPSTEPGNTSFAARYLGTADNDGRFIPRTRSSAGHELPLQMLCAHLTSGWTCQCPGAAAPASFPAGVDPASAFLVHLVPAVQTGTVQVISIGCNHIARPCLADAPERADASTRLRVTLALVPAVSTPPAATLTALADIDSGTAALGLHNADALSGGLAAQSGGRISGTALRVHTTPGAPAAAALVPADAGLAALTPAQLFSRHFGTDLPQWMQQPGVQALDCSANCAARLQTVLAGEAEVARIGLRGDLQLSGNSRVGAIARPVVLVVDGALQLSGPVQIHGMVYARSLRWDDVSEAEGGLLHGAVLLSEAYAGNGAPDMVYDAALMAKLKRQSGSWVRVPGSWRDF